MEKKLAVQKFIESHSDWEKMLSEKPYSIRVSRKTIFGRNLVLLKYSLMDEPDFSNEVVQECRGLILDEDTLEIVSYPFRKFGNYNEGDWVDTIDWNTAKVGTKIDGSIIKVVRVDGNLLISTNGCIDADDATLSDMIPNCPFRTYGEIIRHCLSETYSRNKIDDSIFKDGMTYMFELVSPYTRVVVSYPMPKLYLIGIRDNDSLKETYFRDHELAQWFETPEEHSIRTIDECIDVCSKLPWDQEGYVVVDADFHRVKVKSFAYLAIHRLANNGVMTYSRAIELFLTNECTEVLAYFPEYTRIIDEVRDKFEHLVNNLNATWDGFMTIVTKAASRKEQAAWIIKNFEIPGVGFAMLDNKIQSPEEWLRAQPSWKITELLKLNKKCCS